MKTERILQINEELNRESHEIMKVKNHDYKGGDEDGLSNFKGSIVFGVSPVQGILLRVQDKMKRIQAFDAKGELKVPGEGVIDAVIDVKNYMTLIYAMFEDEGRLNEKHSS
jgi:hypothetical protein